jgi:hypothetical protein
MNISCKHASYFTLNVLICAVAVRYVFAGMRCIQTTPSHAAKAGNRWCGAHSRQVQLMVCHSISRHGKPSVSTQRTCAEHANSSTAIVKLDSKATQRIHTSHMQETTNPFYW